MAELILQMDRDPETGRPRFRVGLVSDADTPNFEHEQNHRALVRELFGPGAAVERESRPLMPAAGVG